MHMCTRMHMQPFASLIGQVHAHVHTNAHAAACRLGVGLGVGVGACPPMAHAHTSTRACAHRGLSQVSADVPRVLLNRELAGQGLAAVAVRGPSGAFDFDGEGTRDFAWLGDCDEGVSSPFP